MKKTREQRGITLIALIITIVVLLILAAVAIASIQNDGIISHAGNVTNQYNESVANEQGILEGYLNYLNGGNGSNGGGLTEEDLAEIDLVERYILGANKAGRAITEIVNMGTLVFIDELSTIPNASTEITPISMTPSEDGTKTLAYIKYKNKTYEVIFDTNTGITEKVNVMNTLMVPEELQKYILGTNKTGRLITEILNNDTGVFKDESSTISEASSKVLLINFDTTTSERVIKYEDNYYTVKVNAATSMTQQITAANKLLGENSIDLDAVFLYAIGTIQCNFLYTNNYLIEVYVGGSTKSCVLTPGVFLDTLGVFRSSI